MKVRLYLSMLFRELRYALRALVKRPGLTLTTTLTLGLGIGLTTTMFAVVNGSVWSGLPFERPDRVVHIERVFAARAAADPAVPLGDFIDWRLQQTSLEDIAAFAFASLNVSGAVGEPRRYSGAYITANTFDLLGVAPAIGRAFRPDDDRPGAPPVAIVSDEVWRDQFERSPGFDDLTIRVDGYPVPVVGIMPPRFRFPLNQDVWLPLRLDTAAVTPGTGSGLQVLGRLRDGATVASAQAEFAAIAARLEREYPATHAGVGAVVRPYVAQFLGEALIAIFYTFFAAAAVVLLIACTNVANLLLVTTAVRTREMAVRSALGASRRRVVFLLLIEVLALAAAGGAAGVPIARLGVRLFNDAIAGTSPPFWMAIRFDRTEAVFVAGLVLLVSAIAGVVPAVRASGVQVVDVLRDESRGGTGWRLGRLSRTLVVIEIALSSALLVGAGLLVRSVGQVAALDFGFTKENVLTASVALPQAGYPGAAQQRQFWRRLVARLDEQPGVRMVTLTSHLPAMGSARSAVAAEGTDYRSEREYPLVRTIVISPGFFNTFDVPIADGRDFGSMDGPSERPVAIVNHKFAERFLPGRSPIGRRLRVVGAGRDTFVTVVGVAPNMRMAGARDRDPEALYLPLSQSAAPMMNLAVRASGEMRSATSAVRDAVATLDPDLAIHEMQTLERALNRVTWFYGTFGRVFVVFASASLALAVVGLYGLMAFSVSQRTREIGVRLAMGARRIDILRMVFGQALVQVAVGLAAGITLAAWLSRLLAMLLVGVTPRDPGVYSLTALVLVATALVAVAGPAIRAAWTNPTRALRHE